MVPEETKDIIRNALSGFQTERRKQIDLVQKIIGEMDVETLRTLAREYRGSYNRQTQLMHKIRRALIKEKPK